MQICLELGTEFNLFDDTHSVLNYKLRGVGKGATKDGKKKTWKKKFHFEQDLLSLSIKELGLKQCQQKFAGLSVAEINQFWEFIKDDCTRPKETVVHAKNKLLLWLDKLHNSLSWADVKSHYKIGVATAVSYTHDTMNGILSSFQNENIINFPSEEQSMLCAQAEMEGNVEVSNINGCHVSTHCSLLKEHSVLYVRLI